MEAEAEPVLRALGLEKDEPPAIAPPAPCVTFSGSALGLDLHIVCNGAIATHTAPNQIQRRARRGSIHHGACGAHGIPDSAAPRQASASLQQAGKRLSACVTAAMRRQVRHPQRGPGGHGAGGADRVPGAAGV